MYLLKTLLFTFILASCSQNDSKFETSVANKNWVLIQLGEKEISENSGITAFFDSKEMRLYGVGGCNRYFASYELEDKQGLHIPGPIGSTKMYCPENMEDEGAYFAALAEIRRWELDQGRLKLITPQVTLVFKYGSDN